MLDRMQSWRTLTGLSPADTQVMEWVKCTNAALQHDHLCILNWNIAKRNHRMAWQQEFDHVFRRYHPDLCFLQEVRLPWPVLASLFIPELEGRLPPNLGWYFTPNLIHHRQGNASGVLTASISHTISNFALSSRHCEPFLKTPKVALVTEYPIAGQTQTLLAINVHGINFVRSYQFQDQLHQIESAIAHHRGPLILAGDFNTWRPKRMQMLHDSVDRLNLKPVHFDTDCQNQLKRFLLSDPLDHVFYRGLKLQSEATKVLGELKSSDHKPMVVTFSILPEVDAPQQH